MYSKTSTRSTEKDNKPKKKYHISTVAKCLYDELDEAIQKTSEILNTEKEKRKVA